ncbi:MAG: 2,4-dichlorophenol 6-monooxygenase [Actinomycetota bacterium]|jgi:2,4-dichlorophenol 6-monooxygenase
MTTKSDIDVLIVGAGPVGISAAMLLHKMGHSVRIIDRREGPQRAPAAHVINARTFEVWRQIGVNVDHLRSIAQDPQAAGQVHWVTKLGGEVLGSLPYERQGDEMLSFTPTPLRNLAQHVLEPLLVDELTAMGVNIEYSTQWLSMVQKNETVVSTMRHHGNDEVVAAKYVLGCDGASSAVRQASGIAMEGPDNLQSFAMIHFTADLSSLTRECPGVLYWLCDQGMGGTLISHGGDNEWVYMHPVDADHVLDQSPDVCESMVRSVLIDAQVDIKILRTSSWTMTSQIADRYRDGQVFLVGDAAHRFPPSGGMGLNSGVQDAHNLAWKLHAVITGQSNDSLLNTYEPERRPVAQRNAQASLENAFKMFEVFEALGKPNQEGLIEAINNQQTHFDMFGLQMGYRYELEVTTTPLAPLSDDIIRNYTPSSEPGSRLPHGWLIQDGKTISSLDLIDLTQATVIVGPSAQVSYNCLQVGRDFEDPNAWWSNVLGLPDDACITVRPDQHVASRDLVVKN